MWEVEERIKNPPDRHKLILGALITLLPLVIGLFFVLSNLLVPALLMLIIALSLMPLMPYNEYVRRPFEVEVGDTIVLRYRRSIDIRDIAAIECLVVFDQKNYLDKYTGGWLKFVQDKDPFPVTHEIARSVAEVYRHKVGKEPPAPYGKGL